MTDNIGQLKKGFSNKVRLLRFCFSGTGTYEMGLLFTHVYLCIRKKCPLMVYINLLSVMYAVL